MSSRYPQKAQTSLALQLSPRSQLPMFNFSGGSPIQQPSSTVKPSTPPIQVAHYGSVRFLHVWILHKSLTPPRSSNTSRVSHSYKSRSAFLADVCSMHSLYIDRIYLAAYTTAPSEHTPFPYPSTPSRSPTKRSSKAQPKQSSGPRVHPPCYFSIDDELPYNRFHADFGPLHIGHVYRFSLLLNYLLALPDNDGRALVLWSKPDSRSRANAACLLACYMILVQEWPPHLALAPIAQAEPPLMPFRDAGYSQADFSISIQDVLYGVWRAKQEGLCSLDGFKLDE